MFPLAGIVSKPVSGMCTTARVGRTRDDQRSLSQQSCQSTGRGSRRGAREKGNMWLSAAVCCCYNSIHSKHHKKILYADLLKPKYPTGEI